MEEQKPKVIQDKILGTRKEGNKLYLLFWERIANSGRVLIWAESEEKAIDWLGYNTQYCKLTVVEIQPENMPVEVGTAR